MIAGDARKARQARTKLETIVDKRWNTKILVTL